MNPFTISQTTCTARNLTNERGEMEDSLQSAADVVCPTGYANFPAKPRLSQRPTQLWAELGESAAQAESLYVSNPPLQSSSHYIFHAVAWRAQMTVLRCLFMSKTPRSLGSS